jgi:hypothetical protein
LEIEGEFDSSDSGSSHVDNSALDEATVSESDPEVEHEEL